VDDTAHNQNQNKNHRPKILGLILAGGQGSRMQGVDKGLQKLNDKPLVLHAVARLAPQVRHIAINANRNLLDYACFGFSVVNDDVHLKSGPLSGILAGLQQATKMATRFDFLAVAPCDVPFAPSDWVPKLGQALLISTSNATKSKENESATSEREINVAFIKGQPVFCLLHCTPKLTLELADFLQQGGRRMQDWLQMQNAIPVPVAPMAMQHVNGGDRLVNFDNINTDSQLQQANQMQTIHPKIDTLTPIGLNPHLNLPIDLPFRCLGVQHVL
jgi:molybdopterin-guanine dinucleotide biosynthesis protein A